MNRIRRLHERHEIEAFLSRNPRLHVYARGDLDDLLWPRTTWYGLDDGAAIAEVVLIYEGPGLPTVLAISEYPGVMRTTLAELKSRLPAQFYAHLSPTVEGALHGTHDVEPHGPHYKMALGDPSAARKSDCRPVSRLTQQDLEELLCLYAEGHPGNWFDPDMLDTGQYFGLRVDGRLIRAAGVHVYSPRYRTAAIGNVVTHPAHRNQGHARLVMARLCRSLLEKVDHVGLNVKTDNAPAMACYRRLGFAILAEYGEFRVARTIG